MIFVSTGGQHSQTAVETVRDWMGFGLVNFELSGGKPWSDVANDLLELQRLGARLSLHNYFPPPQEPFVFNLASSNPEIAEKSFKHVEAAISLSAMLGGEYYSFHAGFLIDPDVRELGKTISKRKLAPRDEAIALFVDRVGKLAYLASESGVKLLVENNVLSTKNFQVYGENPLLMVGEEDILEIMGRLPSEVGLLLDVGHLKVSATTLGFAPGSALASCNSYVSAYHLSDNDGITDTNGRFSEDSWFWEFLDSRASFATVEVYSPSPSELMRQVEIVEAKLRW